jgi:hypothetical protein
MRDSRSLSWKEPYLAALKESDKQKILELVHAAEEAIFLRQQELADSEDHHEERSEIGLACENLLTIKTHILGWPSPLASQPNSLNTPE